MRLEWLEDIMAIAETGSFSGAAERRRLTQSAFSRRVRQIEEHIGVELFDRNHKPIRLRPTTQAQSEQILLLAAGLRQLVVDLRRGERMASNKVLVACQHSLATVRFPAILRQAGLQKADLHVRLRSANLDECTGLLVSRQADIAIVYHLPDEPKDATTEFLDVITFGSDLFVPVGSADVVLPPADGDELIDLPMITYPADVYFGRVMELRIMPTLNARIRTVPRVETALTLAAAELAVAGVGVAWVPESLIKDDLRSGRLIDLSKRFPVCELQIQAMRIQGSQYAAADLFWSHLADAN
jgi:DNA-binding transcriptional LysR family regulator